MRVIWRLFQPSFPFVADLEAFYRGAGERMETLMGAVNARPDENRRMKWKKINSAKSCWKKMRLKRNWNTWEQQMFENWRL